jgi:hypothetical protein
MEEVRINFLKDWQDQLKLDMKTEGIEIDRKLEAEQKSQRDQKLGIEDFIVKYLTYLRKKGMRLPYKIHFSREFREQKEYTEKYKKAISEIVEIFKNGDDIGPYLSKGAIELKNDPLFNHWGVIHLHLGDEPDEKNKKYIKRTSPLLFVCLYENGAYFIKICEDNKKGKQKKHNTEWAELEIVQIMENNWPETIGKLIGTDGLGYIYPDKDRFGLWNNGGDTVLEIKSNTGEPIIAVSPGGFAVASGDAGIDSLNYISKVKKLSDIEKEIIVNIEFIKTKIKNQGIDLKKGLDFKLMRDDNEWYIVETNSNALIKTNKKLNNMNFICAFES